MTAELVLRDLAAWSLQVGLLIGVGALLARLLPLRPPAFALAYWQTLLLACLALPLAQPWNQAPRDTVVVSVTTAPNAAAVAIAAAAPAPVGVPWPSAALVLAIVATGMAIRGAWLAVGLWMLRGLRRRARPLSGPVAAVENAQSALAVAAEFFSSRETQAPITFGLRRPAVLLPESFLGMAPEAQRAIACHELLHVRRRDWLWAVLEECVRALLWFHPAVAWLVSRVQLVREQAVDRAVIALTESREEYLGALLAVAQAKTQLVPASLFLRKGRLKQRVAEILREGSMSRKRLVSHLLVSGCAILLCAAAAVKLFPLQAARAAEEGPVQLLKGGENLLHRAPVEYPKRAFEKGVSGDVLLSLSLDERGQVQDARVLSGPDELRAAALRSVLRWHYSPSAAPGTIDVLLHFRLPEQGERVAEEAEHKEPRPGAEHVARQVEELQKALEDPAVAGAGREKYEHLLREREEQLEHLKRRLHQLESSRFDYASERAETEARAMRAKLAAEQRAQERLQEKMARAIAEQQMLQDRARDMEYAKAARESAEQAAHLKRELDERQRIELQDAENELRAKMASTEVGRQVVTKVLDARESQPGRVTTYTAERGVSTYRPLPGRLSAIHGARLGPEALQALLPQLGVKVGDTLDAAAFERAKAAVAAFDEHIKVELGRAPEDGGLILLLVGPQP